MPHTVIQTAWNPPERQSLTDSFFMRSSWLKKERMNIRIYKVNNREKPADIHSHVIPMVDGGSVFFTGSDMHGTGIKPDGALWSDEM